MPNHICFKYVGVYSDNKPTFEFISFKQQQHSPEDNIDSYHIHTVLDLFALEDYKEASTK